jgi:putative membrane protein
MNSWLRSLVMAIILAIIFTWFAISNSQVVTVSLLVWSLQVSLSLLILISVLIGVILTGLISAMEQTRLIAKINELQGKVKHDEELLKGEKKKS